MTTEGEKAGRKRWVVTLSGRRTLAAVRKDIEAAGFTIEEELEAIGTIIGRCDSGMASKLRQIDGVEDVSPDEPIDIGPPDSPETW